MAKMVHMPNLRKALILAAFAGVAFSFPVSAVADPPQKPNGHHSHPSPAAIPDDVTEKPHVEGHIAFLHAELGITPAQEPAWNEVATAMRDDVHDMQDAESKIANRGPQGQTAIEELENRAMYATLRAQGETRFLKAFRPLYDQLSDTQKRAADELLARHDAE